MLRLFPGVVAVKEVDMQRPLAGGLVRPQTAEDREVKITLFADIIVLPEELETDYLRDTLKVGSRVLVTLDSRQEYELDGEKVLIINEDDILAIVEDEKV